MPKTFSFRKNIDDGAGTDLLFPIQELPVGYAFAAMAGYGSIAQFIISNILVQSDAVPHMRGRTMGILLMAIFGMMPLGSVLTGAVSEHIGAPATVLAQGITAVVIALLFIKFLTRPMEKLRPKTKIQIVIFCNQACTFISE